MSSKRKGSALAMVMSAVVLAPPTYAEPSHFAPTEAGVVYHPEHAGPAKPRAQITAELETAQKHPFWTWATRYGAPWPVAKSGPGKTRDEVRKETLQAMRDGTIPSGER
jgi:hypothetical protein